MVRLKIKRSTPRRVLKTEPALVPPKALPSPAPRAWSRMKMMTATASIICTIWIAGSHWAKIFSSLSCLPIGFRGDYIILRMTSREVVMVPWCPCVAYCDAWLAPSNGTISLSTVTVRSESRRKAVSLVTKSAHPFNNAVAPWSASDVLRFILWAMLALPRVALLMHIGIHFFSALKELMTG